MPPSIWRGEQRDEKKRRRVSVSDKSTVARPFVCLTWPTIPVTCQYFAAHLSTQLFSPTLRSPSLYRVSMHLAKHEAVILYCAGKKMCERETRRVSSCSARRKRAVAKGSPGVAGHKNDASLCSRRLLTHCTDPPCTPSRAEPCRRPLPSRRGTCSSSEASPSSASASASYARSAACAGLPGLDEAALCRLPNSCSENSARSQNPVHEKGRARQGKAARLRGQELKKYATEGDRLLLPLLSDPPRLHLFLSVQRADSRRVAPAAHFYAANIFFTEVVTFLLASFFFLYSPIPS